MKKLTFSTQINAPKERVWEILWSDSSYPVWTSVFSEGSRAETDWKEGSKVLFTDGKGSGMVSKIARSIPNEFMSFEHLGELKDGVEDFTSAEAKGWSGALENYTLREKDGGTELVTEMDADDSFCNFVVEVFPKALQKVKELAEAQKITPFLWFDHQAEEAVNLYTAIFPNSKITSIVKLPNGAVMTAGFELGGQKFAALNGGPMFKINPSISFYVVCETETEVDTAWQKLSEGGSVMMPLDKYPWSEKYGWVQDRFGLSWQLSLGKLSDVGQKFTPSLMFVGEQHGRAEEAMNFYSSVFKNTGVDGILRYAAGESDPTEGTVKHAQFKLEGQKFMAMDSSAAHQFQFNEALSFVINCDTQEEIDYFWDKMTTEGGAESQCGWLKDKFGVSWQVVPPILSQLLGDPDPAKSQRVMQAMMQMKKLDIAVLKQAYE
ncbi:MAG: VOC family protein [Phycisphaerae bacterium]|nr:VOC family protein [Saprospiraceae bacterium]